MKHVNIKIYGWVQGVFFRQSARKKAESLGIGGFARNEPDGAVYIEAEGKEENLEEFLKWCRQGPPLASVDKVEFKYEPKIKEFSGFKEQG